MVLVVVAVVLVVVVVVVVNLVEVVVVECFSEVEVVHLSGGGGILSEWCWW